MGTTVQDAQEIVSSERAWAETIGSRQADTDPVDDDSDGPPSDDGENDEANSVGRDYTQRLKSSAFFMYSNSTQGVIDGADGQAPQAPKFPSRIIQAPFRSRGHSRQRFRNRTSD